MQKSSGCPSKVSNNDDPNKDNEYLLKQNKFSKEQLRICINSNKDNSKRPRLRPKPRILNHIHNDKEKKKFSTELALRVMSSANLFTNRQGISKRTYSNKSMNTTDTKK